MSTRTATQSPPRAVALLRPAVRLPLEHYRLLASALLVALVGISLLAPLGGTPLAAGGTQTPALAAEGSLFDQVFDYRGPAERAAPGTPPRNALLRAAPDQPRFFLAIVAELQNSTEPDGTPSAIRTQALLDTPARWADLQTFYQGQLQQNTADFAVNGLGVVFALQATRATGADKERLARDAVGAFTIAQEARIDLWHYRYNWALGQMLLGRFGTAAAILDALNRRDASHPEARFMEGLADLRTGEAAQAVQVWQPLITNGGEWGTLAQEGVTDAQAAQGDTATAAATYRKTLEGDAGLDWSLYTKLLRLDMQRGAPSAMLATIDVLHANVLQTHPMNQPIDLPRLFYDRGRILELLGQPGPAQQAFEQGAALVPNDPAFPLALAQLFQATGSPRRALTAAEAALRAAQVDPNTADISPALTGQTGDADAQVRGRQVQSARIIQAAAWGALNDSTHYTGLRNGLTSLANGDSARKGWYLYYAGLLDQAAGQQDAARQELISALDAAGTPPAAPSKGLILDALLTPLSPSDATAQAGDLLTRAGGSLTDIPPADDAGLAAFYAHLAGKLEAAGQRKQAGPFYRAAAAWEQQVRATTTSSPVAPTGVATPIEYRAAEAAYLLRSGDPHLAIARYRQLLAVEPALAGAWNNIGVAYQQLGNTALARYSFDVARRLDPGNALAQHNLGVLSYQSFDLPGGEAAFGAANRANAPANHAWGYTVTPAGGTLTLPGPAPAGDFLLRLPALIALLLLLLHTVIGRPADDDPAGAGANEPGLLGRVAARLPDWAGRLAVPLTLALAIALAGLAWAWAGAGNNPVVWIALIVPGLIAAAVALGGQEVAQAFAARRERNRGATQPRLSPLGLALAVVTAPFGLVYGWQIVTRAGATGAAGDTPPPPEPPLPTPTTARPGKGGAAPPAFGGRSPLASWAAMGPLARVALVGLLANVVLALVCFALYRAVGWPLWRLALFANLAVLAFTAVSEPQAEGWYLWRRAPLLWLFLFIGAAAALTVVALGAV